MSFVQVSEDNGDDDVVDLPLEKDGTLLLSTLNTQYPDACGLKYVAPDNGRTRALRLAEDKLHPPSDKGWGEIVYFCSFNKDNEHKRKLNEEFESDVERASKEPNSMATSTAWTNRDLLLHGLPRETTVEDLESHFSELRMAQDAFINETPKQIFVGQLTKNITQKDLKDYFKQFGDIVGVVVPHPFKGIAFVSFAKADAALAALDQDHFIKDISLNVSIAMPKVKIQRLRAGRNSGSRRGGHNCGSRRGGRNCGSRRGGRNSCSRRGGRNSCSRRGGHRHYGSRMRGSRDSYNSRDHYYDNGGWDDYDYGIYRYRNNRYDSSKRSNWKYT